MSYKQNTETARNVISIIITAVVVVICLDNVMTHTAGHQHWARYKACDTSSNPQRFYWRSLLRLFSTLT